VNQSDREHRSDFGEVPPRLGRERLDEVLIERIAALKLGIGPIEVGRIEGGISNHNFVVRIGEEAYVARLCKERPLLGVDRRNEVICHRAASRLGLAPELIHCEPGLLVSRFVAGRTLAPADLERPESMTLVAALLRQLHDFWINLIGEYRYFCPFQTVRTYAHTATQIGARLPGDIHQLLSDAALLSRRIAPFRPALCHNDLLAANLIDANARLWLVDWEYAGIGHPSFDLANLAANARFTNDQECELLVAYYGAVKPEQLAELRIFKAMSLLRESLWATIQAVASDIEFDYDRYATENLDAYRKARRRLG
jgi:thiamine kinase-like enzyme